VKSSPSLYEAYTFDYKWIDPAKPPQNSELARFLQAGSKEEAILKQQALYIWGNMVYSYMQRSLTVEQDKLIAISGIARRLQPSIQSDYLAGLWNRDDLLLMSGGERVASVYVDDRGVWESGKLYCLPIVV
jgi:hypothetical protein